jgi:dTDP-L-rhamnose 4-epimerase
MTKGISKVLVTGGAGFIGSHTVDLLLHRGYQVTAIDNMEQQVHESKEVPDYFNPRAKIVVDDFRGATIDSLLEEHDAVLHLAALVGVGQSMYEPGRYVGVNSSGTAELLQRLLSTDHIKKFIVASSMSIYGEGMYACGKCGLEQHPKFRDTNALKKRDWEQHCRECTSVLRPIPTTEETDPVPTSIYAMSKRHQEEMSLLIGKTYDIPTVVLRYFNTYGSRQSLRNPYTGACAIFTSRFLSGRAPYIFEDGGQQRDFTHVKDVARANLLALEHDACNYHAINVGTGKPTPIIELANVLRDLYGKQNEPLISAEYRSGDIRHCYADTGRAQEMLGFRASIGLREGLAELAAWAKEKDWGKIDFFDKALEELRQKELAS